MTSRHLLARTAFVVAVLSGAAREASAQGQSVTLPPNPAVIHTTNTVTVGGTFSVNTGTVAQNSQQANPCNPGACFDAITTVHANRGWQLQVTLNQTPANFTVCWISLPSNQPFPLTPGVWQTIATGTTATPSQQLSSEYNANKKTGPGGIVPTAAQLAAVLTYRVVAFP
jgi:hypothetical protein